MAAATEEDSSLHQCQQLQDWLDAQSSFKALPCQVIVQHCLVECVQSRVSRISLSSPLPRVCEGCAPVTCGEGRSVRSPLHPQKLSRERRPEREPTGWSAESGA